MNNGEHGRPGWDDSTPGYDGTPNHPRYGQPQGHIYGGPPAPGARPVRPGNYGQARREHREYPPPPASWAARHRSVLAVVAAFVAVLAVGTAAWAVLSPGSDAGSGTIAAGDTTAAGGATTADETTTPPAPTTTPAAPKTSATRRVLPKPSSTVKPPAKEIPPPPPPPDPTCTAATYFGANAPVEQVRDALVAAGNHEYWVGVVPPVNLTVPLPKITIPANLMKAIAWQESGWQSAIESCDHGIGTMQIMQATADDTNQRFETTYDIRTLSGNAQMGAQYLERLIMLFGTVSFSQNFNLDAVAAVGPNGTNLTLLQVVVEAYNVGPYAILAADNTILFNDKAVKYYNNVHALMTNCTCLAI